MAEPHAVRRKALVGSPKPRLAPPVPARTALADYMAAAKIAGLEPWPWQQTAARYMYAKGRGTTWLYPEVAVVVGRQNGKTELLTAHILERLKEGRRILHAAQTRELPRMLFQKIAPVVREQYGTAAQIRMSGGQEQIEVPTGGFYKITAATSGGPRGQTIDDLLLDEVRELDEDFIGAALPTTVASMNPQIIYLSNAGDDSTRVLNRIRDRANVDPSLAYLEWSADPELATDDVAGWVQANPAIGHRQGLFENVSRAYRSNKLAGSLAHFETENLCRWVATLRERLVDEYDWVGCRSEEELGTPRSPAIGVSLDPKGGRASVVMAWQIENRVAVRVVRNDTGNPVDVEAIGREVRDLQSRHGAEVGFDPLTDAQLARYVRKGKAISMSGGKFANASATFVAAIQSRRLAWTDADAITDDLTWTARKQDGSSVGSYQAVRAQDDRPITAALAAIRAVKLADGPQSNGAPRIR